MKTRIFESIIITGILVSSMAQANSAITVEDINASYLNPSFTRNTDVSSYTAPAQPQGAQKVLAASTSAALSSSANIVGDINASYLNPSFTRNADVSSYTASTQPQGTQKVLTASTAGTYNLDPSGVVRFN